MPQAKSDIQVEQTAVASIRQELSHKSCSSNEAPVEAKSVTEEVKHQEEEICESSNDNEKNELNASKNSNNSATNSDYVPPKELEKRALARKTGYDSRTNKPTGPSWVQ